MTSQANDAAPRTVLFACVHNAGRSQMAAALFNRVADSSKARALSAGTDPGTRVHPEVVEAMRELGVDLSAGQPQRLTDELAASATMLVTMGCGEACPVVPGLARDDWPLEDPKGKTLERVREIRAEIEARVQDLLLSRAWLPWTVRDARPDERAAAEELLRAAKLPTQGVADHFGNFTIAVDAASRLAGVAGLELYGPSALLRSVAVRVGDDRRGLGSILTRRALAKARTQGATEVFLLTETAEAFFERRGFERVARVDVPRAVAASGEFNGVCPDSATVLRRRL
jgi:protein-tyrosine-phosphatase/N-acetylglutamate synthase-like GNAT family acetyltransferase